MFSDYRMELRVHEIAYGFGGGLNEENVSPH